MGKENASPSNKNKKNVDDRYAQGKTDTETNFIVTVDFTTKVDHQTTSKIWVSKHVLIILFREKKMNVTCLVINNASIHITRNHCLNDPPPPLNFSGKRYRCSELCIQRMLFTENPYTRGLRSFARAQEIIIQLLHCLSIHVHIAHVCALHENLKSTFF